MNNKGYASQSRKNTKDTKEKSSHNTNEKNLSSDLEEYYKELAFALTECINTLRQNPQYLIPFLENKLSKFVDEYVFVPNNKEIFSNKSFSVQKNVFDHIEAIKNKSTFTKTKSNNKDKEVLNLQETPILFVEGKSAIEEAISFLYDQEPCKEYVFNNFLNKSAKDHAVDLGTNGILSHEGSDGKSLVERIEKVCDWNGMLSENLEFGSLIPEDILCTWIIDDGVSLRTHRSNIFSDKYVYMAVGISGHSSEGLVTVVDFAEELYGYNEKNPNIIEKTYYIYPSKTEKNKFINTYLEIDSEAPENTINVYKSIVVKNTNGKTTQKTKKIYTLEDGNKIEKEV